MWKLVTVVVVIVFVGVLLLVIYGAHLEETEDEDRWP